GGRYDLVVRSEDGGDVGRDLRRSHAGSGREVDRVECAGHGQDALRCREVEGGDGHSAEIRLALQPEETDDRELLGRALQQHPYAVADGEAVRSRRPLVDEDLAVATRRPALAVVGERERAGAGLGPGETDRGGEAVLDRVAVPIDDLRVAEGGAVGGGDAVD